MIKDSLKKTFPMIVLVIVVAILCASAEGYMNLLMMDTIDLAVAGDRLGFETMAIRLLVVAFLLLPMNIGLSFCKGFYKKKAMTSAKFNYISKAFNKPIHEFQKHNSSKYISSLTNDMHTVEMNYIDGIYEIIISVVYFIVGILVIASVSPIALGIGIGLSIVSATISFLLGKPLQKHQTQRSLMFEGYTGYIKEVLSAFHIVKANNLIKKVSDDYFHKSQSIQEKGYVIDKIYTYILGFQNLNMMISMYSLLGITAFMALRGYLTLGGVILIINNMEKLMVPIMRISEWMPKINSTKTLFEKIDDTLSVETVSNESITMPPLKSEINIRNISFQYDQQLVLENASASFQKGGKYLIVGPSGGGKSTLLKLLRKYFTPLEGNIWIDNHPLKDITKTSYYEKIANVEQQVFLFEDTLYNNITLYKSIDSNFLNHCIDKAGLKDFVRQLPHQLDTLILDNGRNISGGEKSRIAIARGLVNQADIIFLDEAFANLDDKHGKKIEHTLLTLENVTVINVSHVIYEENKALYDDIYLVKDQKIVSIK